MQDLSPQMRAAIGSRARASVFTAPSVKCQGQNGEAESYQMWNLKTQAPIYNWPLTYYVIWDKSLHLSELQFYYL